MRPAVKYLIILTVFMLFSIHGCGRDDGDKNSGKGSGPAYGDAIIQGSIGDASNLLPVISSDSVSSELNQLVYNGLVKIDKNLNLTGDLAEKWDVSDDGRTITFHLHQGVRWHDGKPFTSKDCAFTYRVMVDPKTPTAYAEQFKQIESVETPDDYTFRVTYSRPFARALITWGMYIVPAHLLEGKDITTSPLARHPVGTGPYRFKEWLTGQKIIIEANPDYFEGKPYIAQKVLRIIPDNATMFLELKSGGLDWMKLTPVQYQRQTETKDFNNNYNKFKYLDFSYTYLGFNLLKERFKDKRVRQAIAYAIDKDEIIQGVLLGLGAPANGPYKPDHWVANKNVKPYPFDQSRAKELLAEAGWTDSDKDGIIDKDGRPFEFILMTNLGNKRRETTALIIQQRLKEVGISVKVRTIEWTAFLKEFLDKKNFEAVIMGWTIPIDPDLYNVWHSSKTAEGELNFISFKNEEVDELIDKGRFTLDQEERKAAYDRIQEILYEEVPYVFLYYPDALPVVSSRFRGIQPAPAGIDYDFIKWYAPKGLQKYETKP